MRRLTGQREKVSFRLPATERLEAAALARRKGQALSGWLREAVREKIERESREEGRSHDHGA